MPVKPTDKDKLKAARKNIDEYFNKDIAVVSFKGSVSEALVDSQKINTIKLYSILEEAFKKNPNLKTEFYTIYKDLENVRNGFAHPTKEVALLKAAEIGQLNTLINKMQGDPNLTNYAQEAQKYLDKISAANKNNTGTLTQDQLNDSRDYELVRANQAVSDISAETIFSLSESERGDLIKVRQVRNHICHDSDDFNQTSVLLSKRPQLGFNASDFSVAKTDSDNLIKKNGHKLIANNIHPTNDDERNLIKNTNSINRIDDTNTNFKCEKDKGKSQKIAYLKGAAIGEMAKMHSEGKSAKDIEDFGKLFEVSIQTKSKKDFERNLLNKFKDGDISQDALERFYKTFSSQEIKGQDNKDSVNHALNNINEVINSDDFKKKMLLLQDAKKLNESTFIPENLKNGFKDALKEYLNTDSNKPELLNDNYKKLKASIFSIEEHVFYDEYVNMPDEQKQEYKKFIESLKSKEFDAVKTRFNEMCFPENKVRPVDDGKTKIDDGNSSDHTNGTGNHQNRLAILQPIAGETAVIDLALSPTNQFSIESSQNPTDAKVIPIGETYPQVLFEGNLALQPQPLTDPNANGVEFRGQFDFNTRKRIDVDDTPNTPPAELKPNSAAPEVKPLVVVAPSVAVAPLLVQGSEKSDGGQSIDENNSGKQFDLKTGQRIDGDESNTSQTSSKQNDGSDNQGDNKSGKHQSQGDGDIAKPLKPNPGNGFGAGTLMGFSGFLGTIRQYQESGYNQAYGLSLGSISFDVAHDITGGNLLGNGKAAKVFNQFKLPLAIGFIPDLVNLNQAQTDDQRNAAITNLGVTGGTTLLLQASSIAGPEAVALVMATNYVASKTIAPALKIADGYLSDDKEKMDIGNLRLKAGTSELSYKISKLPGQITLMGDITSGIGDVMNLTGDLIHDGTSWVVGKAIGDKYSIAYDNIHKAGIYFPNDASLAFKQFGDALNWTGSKLNQLGDWVSDNTGIGVDERNSIKQQTKEADELQAKYDEAHKLKIQIPPEVIEINSKIEAYNKSAKNLLTILQEKGNVKTSVLDKAYKDYQTSYTAMIDDPMYKAGANTLIEQMQKSGLANLQQVQDSTNPQRRMQSMEERKARNEDYSKEQHELELFMRNPVTADFKANTQTFNQQIGGFVEAKRNERLGYLATQSYAITAKGYEYVSKELELCQKDIAKLNLQLSYVNEWIKQAGKEGTLVTTEALAQARESIAKLEEIREAQMSKLDELQQSTEKLIEQNKKAMASNTFYKDKKESKNLGQALVEMKSAITKTDLFVQCNQQEATEQIAQGLAELDKKAQPVSVITPASTAVTDNTEIKQNEAVIKADKELKDKIAEVSKDGVIDSKDKKLIAEASKALKALGVKFDLNIESNNAKIAYSDEKINKLLENQHTV